MSLQSCHYNHVITIMSLQTCYSGTEFWQSAVIVILSLQTQSTTSSGSHLHPISTRGGADCAHQDLKAPGVPEG